MAILGYFSICLSATGQSVADRPAGARQHWFSASPGSTAPSEESSLREVKVLVVSGREHRAFYRQWQERARTIVEGASRRLEPVGLRLKIVGYQPWLYDQAPKTADDAFRWLHEIDPGEADLVIGFTMVAFPGPHGEIRGLTQYFSRYVVLPDVWGTPGATTRLVHELCHVFGAFHVAVRHSVMQPGFARTPQEYIFGEPVEKTISLTRGFDFHQGIDCLPEESRKTIQELYRQHRHPLDKPDADPITSWHRYQALRAEWKKESGNLDD